MAYYYLSASLTPLEFGDMPDIGFMELMERYNVNLSASDKKQLEVIRLFFDLENIKRIYNYRSEPFHIDPRGNLSKNELKKALEEQTFFPLYVYDFFREHEAGRDVVLHYAQLLSTYYKEEAENWGGFIKEYLEFERNLRLILTGVRAKKLKKVMQNEFILEDLHDPVIATLLNQKDSPYFEAPAGYEELQEMLLVVKDNPMQQYRQLAEYRFRKVREMVASRSFTIDYLLGYAIRVSILEDLHALDSAKGREVLNSIVKDTA